MKVRHLCAALGVAIATGTVVFVKSLVATNDHQAVAVAQNLLKALPVEEGALTARLSLDFRPGGHVLQGPPMMAFIATDGKLGPTALKTGECLVTEALFAQRRQSVPPVGTELSLVGRKGAYKLRIAGVRHWARSVRGYPNLFVSAETAETIDEDWTVWEKRTAEDLAPLFTSMAARHFGWSKPLLLWAAALTALCLLLNSLFLSIEARRREIAVLRMLGLTRWGVVKMVGVESVALTLIGGAFGILASIAALAVYVAADKAQFPMGMAVSWPSLATCAGAAPFVALLAVLLALRPALAVRPLEAASSRMPRRKSLGMTIAFACGYGAFVSVEVWGASLMSAFVPSAEWPDAIVSILPAGVSSFDIEKLQGKVKGVRKIHELQPLQVNFDPLEEQKGFGGDKAKGKGPDPSAQPRGGGAPGPKRGGAPGPQGAGAPGPGGGRGPGRAYRNVLLLGSDWLPPFRFVAGDATAARKAIAEGDACVITEMMARARNLKLGDDLKLDAGRGLKIALKIVGIVDCNWHMVTSRGLVRGLNRMPNSTDGPAFVSFDTVEACDARPSDFVQMTHLWLDYEPEFVREHGVFEAGRRVEREIVRLLGGARLTTEEGDDRGNAVRLHARDEVADGTLAHGNDIIGSMARVPFIFIAVVSLGFIAMLVAGADSRKREFVVLRTVGATRTQLAALLAKEATGVALKGLLIGLIGGALAGWLFTFGTRATMATWGIPPNFVLPWAVVAKGAAGAFAFALAVAVPTSLAVIRRATKR